jgi:CubicO group peptidase (beta-lactamase class C family)
MRTLPAVLASLLLFTSSSNAQQISLRDFDRYVDRVLHEFEVPGAAVAIVKDGRVVSAKGYGVRTLGRPEQVDRQTLFGIASNTKAFTATALALLVEDGTLEWDKPVIDYLPSFRLSNPYVTSELTVRDLLVHRSGLPLGAGDLLWWPPTTYTRAEIVDRLRHLPLTTSFRSAYAYDNVLYAVAGELVQRVSGQTWEDFISSKIFARVDMGSSKPMASAASGGTNTATTHARVDGRVQIVKPFLSDNTNPVGGINSNAEDMAKWMIVQLDSGRLANGGRLFSASTARELWSLVTPIPIADGPAELRTIRPNFNGYGLGFAVRDYRGTKIVTHGGVFPGYVSRLTMVPELKLGIVVLTNQESIGALDAIVYYVLDRYLKAPPYDWISVYRTLTARDDSTAHARERSAAAARDSSSHPSLPLERYAGTYRDDWYGDVVITKEGGTLGIRFARTEWLAGDLEHWQYDTFVARWHDRSLRADAFVTFLLRPDGSIDQVTMKAVSPATDFSFDFHHLLLKPIAADTAK